MRESALVSTSLNCFMRPGTRSAAEGRSCTRADDWPTVPSGRRANSPLGTSGLAMCGSCRGSRPQPGSGGSRRKSLEESPPPLPEAHVIARRGRSLPAGSEKPTDASSRVHNRRIWRVPAGPILTWARAESAGPHGRSGSTPLSVISSPLAHAREPFLDTRADPVLEVGSPGGRLPNRTPPLPKSDNPDLRKPR
jgi:hypothetical protein